MAYPNNHVLGEVMVSTQASAATVVGVIRLPFRCKVVKVGQVLGGAITSAALVTTASIIPAVADAAAPGSGTNITHPALSTATTNSAIGSSLSVVPTAANFGNEDDLLVFTPSGAAGASTPVTYFAVLQKA